MARRKVVKVVCDNCKEEDDPNIDDGVNKRNPLPLGWARIDIASDEGHMFDGELCDKCVAALMNGLKKRYND
jgi:hypothetical protein